MRRSERRKSEKKEDAGARAKAAGALPSGQIRNEKLDADVARSTCPSQIVQSTSASDHF